EKLVTFFLASVPYGETGFLSVVFRGIEQSPYCFQSVLCQIHLFLHFNHYLSRANCLNPSTGKTSEKLVTFFLASVPYGETGFLSVVFRGIEQSPYCFQSV